MAMLNHQMVIGSSYFNIFQLFWGWYSHRNHQRWCAKHQQGPCACGPTRAMAPWLAAKRARDGRMPGYFWWDGMGTDGHGKWWKLVPKQHVFFSAPKGSSFAYERGILEPTEDWGVSAAPGIKVENIWKYNQVTGTNGWSFSSVVSSEKHLQLSPFPGFALLSGTSIPYLFAMLVDFRGHGNIRGGFSTIKGVRSSWRQEVCSSEIEVVFHSTARGGSCITMDPQGAVPLMY